MKNILFVLSFFIISMHSYAQDLSGLFEESIKSVVTIYTTEFKFSSSNIEQSASLGSGVIINTNGMIMTAAHVVESANLIKVKLHDGKSYDAEIIRSIPSADIALIKIVEKVPGLKAVEMNKEEKNKVKSGHQVYIIGAPLGIEQSLSSGYVSGFLDRNALSNGNAAKFIQTDAAVNKGNSGGPMFNMKGHLIGIVSFILSQSGGSEGIGYAVDIRTAKQLLIDDDSHFWSGFDGYILDENLSAVLNIPQKTGILVQRVTKNSFADSMGLEGGFFQTEIFKQKLWLGGDIILEICDSRCDSPHSLESIKEHIQKIKPGESIKLKVLRRGKIVNLTKMVASK